MVYEHPLAYLLGLEGIALLRAFTGEHDRAFVDARLAEVRALLADESLVDAAVHADRFDTVTGYRDWSARYDDPGNVAFQIDTPIVQEIVGTLPTGVALDAACGTGRYARWLAERGHKVIGVDSSPDMLALARTRVPEAEFLLGDLHRLPVDDATVDLVVCALALNHNSSLDPILAEFARVLRPGGHLVITDTHPEAVARGSIPTVRSPEGQPGRIPVYRYLVGDYLRAALSSGFQLRRCEEPVLPPAPAPAPTKDAGPWDLWPWSLARMVPEAAQAASAGVPAMLIWDFELDGSMGIDNRLRGKDI
ncbi:methyltransferase domain-containing protein [Nocardia sp. NPDC046473]|uniref:class I SAM-dependent methyltransferase n=1 Tax=Nocardia sp. NPDC046473 TaxID=3155733 RepID=UPI0033E27860